MGQVKKKIKRGRRNKSESQFMLDKDYLQAEWEIGHETIKSDVNSTVYPNLVLRYGISKQFEVNAEVNFITAHDETAAQKNVSGVEPVSLGANLLLLSETKQLPAVIFSGQLALPFMASKNFTANYAAPSLQMIIEKALSQKLIIALSGGSFWDGFSPKATFIYNTTASYSLSTKWVLTSEWFGFINGGPPQHNTDISVSYSPSKSLQFGITSGVGISPAAHKNYLAVNGVWGCSFRRKKHAVT
jgi:hypothetical protein